MGKASTGKKVARAASTGGGRTNRGTTSWGWWSAMLVIFVLGTAALVVSLDDYKNEKVVHPTLRDHWHVAYGFYDCDKFAAQLPQPSKLIGVHTHDDGLIHVEPQNSQDTGKNATLARFVTGNAGMKLTKTSITYPGVGTRKNGDKCGSKAGELSIRIWDNKDDKSASTFIGNPKEVRLKDGEIMTIAFAAKGTEIPQPPSVPNLADPNKGEAHNAGTTAETVPGETTTTAPGATASSTTAPGATASSTTAPASATTAPAAGSTSTSSP